MYTINFVEGECGNVGKSLFAMMLCEAYQRRSRGYNLVDMDRLNRDVGQRYRKAVMDIYFSVDGEDNLRTDRLVTLAQSADVIVNLPAGSLDRLQQWFDLNPIEGLKVNRWFVSVLDQKSLIVLEQLLENNQNSPLSQRLILVHNQRDGIILKPDLAERLEVADVPVIKMALIDLPHQDRFILEDVKHENLSPADLALKFGRLGKMRWDNAFQNMALKIDSIAG